MVLTAWEPCKKGRLRALLSPGFVLEIHAKREKLGQTAQSLGSNVGLFCLTVSLVLAVLSGPEQETHHFGGPTFKADILYIYIYMVPCSVLLPPPPPPSIWYESPRTPPPGPKPQARDPGTHGPTPPRPPELAPRHPGTPTRPG